MLVNLAAVLGILIVITCVFGYPFIIGRPKTGTYTAGSYLTNLFECAIVLILAGHALNWW